MAEERKNTRKRKEEQPLLDLIPSKTYEIEALKGSQYLKEGAKYSVSGASAAYLIAQGKAKLV